MLSNDLLSDHFGAGPAAQPTPVDNPEDYPLVKAVRALALMRQAMVLLDEAGARIAGNHLRHAIDTLDVPHEL